MEQHQRPIYIEHPDIPRASVNRLSKELEYIRTQYLRSVATLNETMHKIYMGIPTDYPLWMYQDDLNFCIERYRAICEEIEYRKQMMR